MTPQPVASATTPVAGAVRSVVVAVIGVVASWVTVVGAFILLVPPMQFGQQVEPPPHPVADVVGASLCAAVVIAALVLAVRWRRVGTLLVASVAGVVLLALPLGLVG